MVSSNSLSSLSKICPILLFLCHFLKNCQFQDISVKNCMQLQKAHHKPWLVAAPSQMAWMKVMPRVGRRRITPPGTPSGRTPPSPSKEEESSWGAGDSMKVARILNHDSWCRWWQSWDHQHQVGGGPCEVHCRWERPHTRNFLKGGLKRSLRFWIGTVTLHEIHKY